MPNELKTEDVMKALEQMASKANCNYMRHLEGCGYFCIRLGKNVDDMAKGRSPECNANCEHFSPPYIEEVLRSALALLRDLFRELKEKDAEIERLKHQISIYHKMIDICESKYEMLDFLTKKARDEAITEFAERIVKAIHPEYPLSVCQVYQIAKEMKGDHVHERM